MSDERLQEAKELEEQGELEKAADIYEKEGLPNYAEILREMASEEEES